MVKCLHRVDRVRLLGQHQRRSQQSRMTQPQTPQGIRYLPIKHLARLQTNTQALPNYNLILALEYSRPQVLAVQVRV